MPEFKLVPFPSSVLPNIYITGEIQRRDNQVSIHYEVSGDIGQIALPGLAAPPIRKYDLWKATCFEFFLALPGQPQYWEFNMSPSGDWNVYQMDAYRRVGFQEERLIKQLQVGFQNEAGKLTMKSDVDLKPLFQNGGALDAGITSVIQANDGTETYWALAHPGRQADFHLRESFALTV